MKPRGRPPHPLFEVIAQDVANRKASGKRGYIVSTALDYGVSQGLVYKALRSLGIEPAGGWRPPPKHRPSSKLSEEEQKAIRWCPECGNIHVYLPCEWCAGWSNAKVKAQNDRKQAKKVYKKEILRKKQWLAKRARDIARHHFFGNSPPTKDG